MTSTTVEQIGIFDPEISIDIKINWPVLTAEKTAEIVEQKIRGGMQVKEILDLSGLHYNTLNKLRKDKVMGYDSQIQLLNALGLCVRITIPDPPG